MGVIACTHYGCWFGFVRLTKNVEQYDVYQIKYYEMWLSSISDSLIACTTMNVGLDLRDLKVRLTKKNGN